MKNVIDFPTEQDKKDDDPSPDISHLSERQQQLLRIVASEINEAKKEFRKMQEAENQRLGSKWEKPELVCNEKEFKEAAEFLNSLHPDTREIAITLLHQQ